MGFYPRFCDHGVYPAITTLVLIAVALIAGGLVWIVVRGQSSVLSRNVDVEVQSINLVVAHKTGQFSVTLKNTGTVRIDDTRVELREIPDYPVLRIFDEPGGGAVGIPISDVRELQDIRNDLDNNYYLTQNIDASETRTWNNGKGFKPIGDPNNPFTGRLNGNGYVIKNLYINRESTDDVGLFGCTRSGAVIENVELRNVNIHGYDRVGGLVGWNDNSSYVSNCYSTGEVRGNHHVGGLVGDSSFGARVINCYSTGEVHGDGCVGGLVGYNNRARVINCYSTGKVNGGTDVGGLVGDSTEDSRVDNSFWDVETSGQSSSCGGTGKTTIEMKTESTFTDAGWDFTDTWRMSIEVITLDVGSISPGQLVGASRSFVAPLSSGKTYPVEITAFNSEGNVILEETTTVIAKR